MRCTVLLMKLIGPAAAFGLLLLTGCLPRKGQGSEVKGYGEYGGYGRYGGYSYDLAQQLEESGQGLAQANATADKFSIAAELRQAFESAQSSLEQAKSDPNPMKVGLYCGKLAILRSRISLDTAMSPENHLFIGTLIRNSAPMSCGWKTPWTDATTIPDPAQGSEWSVPTGWPKPGSDSPW